MEPKVLQWSGPLYPSCFLFWGGVIMWEDKDVIHLGIYHSDVLGTKLKHSHFVLNSCPGRACIIAEQMSESLEEGTHHRVLHPRFGTMQLPSPLSHLYSHPSSVLLIVPIHFLTFSLHSSTSFVSLAHFSEWVPTLLSAVFQFLMKWFNIFASSPRNWLQCLV